MASLKSVGNLIGRVQPVTWIALVSGLALIVALNYTLTDLYSSLDLVRQLLVIIVLVVIVSITGFSAISIKGILKSSSGRK